jgi:hypothetical protein
MLQARRALVAATTHVIDELEKHKKLKKATTHGVGTPLVVTRAIRMNSHRREFPMVWQEFSEIRDAAIGLCGESDADIQRCAELLASETAKLGLGKLVAKAVADDALRRTPPIALAPS